MMKLAGCGAAWALCTYAILASTPASARQWPRNPASAANDYSIIIDNRGGGETVIVGWLAAPTVTDTPQNKTLREILEKYVVLLVAHATMQADGTAKIGPIADLIPTDISNVPFKEIPRESLPPFLTGTVATLEAVFSRSLGPMGQGIKMLVFEREKAVSACSKGKLTVKAEGEMYFWDTPFPGCP